MKPTNIIISFHVEPADRGVGIMTEGFLACEYGSGIWCELSDIADMTREAFTWHNGDGEKTDCPKPNGEMVETMLRAYANAWYDQQG